MPADTEGVVAYGGLHNRALVRLFATLAHGERLAMSSARRQARMVSERQASRFLMGQSRQEAMHAVLFQRVAEWLAPPSPPVDIPPGFYRFERRMERALIAGDLPESLVGTQIVLEGLGGHILEQLNRGLDRKDIGFSRQRRVILRQEQAHHAFGLRLLNGVIVRDGDALSRIQQSAVVYLGIADEILAEMTEVFECLDERIEDYRDGLRSSLPDWLQVA